MTIPKVIDYSEFKRIKTVTGLRPDSEVNKYISDGWVILSIVTGVDETGFPLTAIVLGHKSAHVI